MTYNGTPIPAATPANADFTSESIVNGSNGAITKTVSVHVVAAGLNAANGAVKLQESNDGANWVDIAGATATLASGTSSNMLKVTAHTGIYIRVVYTKGSNSAGTIVGYAVAKS
jgi:hypothetical protein